MRWVRNSLKGQGLPVRVFRVGAREACWSQAMTTAEAWLSIASREHKLAVHIGMGASSLSHGAP